MRARTTTVRFRGARSTGQPCGFEAGSIPPRTDCGPDPPCLRNPHANVRGCLAYWVWSLRARVRGLRGSVLGGLSVRPSEVGVCDCLRGVGHEGLQVELSAHFGARCRFPVDAVEDAFGCAHLEVYVR